VPAAGRPLFANVVFLNGRITKTRRIAIEITAAGIDVER
jgi:hypothetical protein